MLFFLKFPESETEDSEVVIKKRKPLEWRRAMYSASKVEFRFKIFSGERFGKTVYSIGYKEPDFTFDEIQRPPARAIFEKAQDDNYKYLRMIVDDYSDLSCMIKIKRSA